MKAPIPQPSGARGGSVAIRGLLVQTLVALLDVAKPASAFTEITLEPLDRGNEKFDYVWRDSDGIHAVQVKSTENTFLPAQVKAWAEEMEREHTNEDCTLLLVGRVHPSLSEDPVGKVNLRIKNLDTPGLLNEAAQGVGVIRESAGLPPRAASENQLVANALVTQLEVYSTQQRRLTRDALIALLRQWIIQAPAQEPKFDISRILKYAPAELIGREEELQLLHAAWSGEFPASLALHGSPFTFQSRPRVLTFVALGGEGKTSLVAKWVADLAAQDWPGCSAAFAWSFYSQGTHEQQAASSDLFLKEALTFFGDQAMAGSAAGAYEKGRRLAQLVGERRALLILDGLEPLQYAPAAPTPGELKDQGIAALLKGLATNSRGLCVITTRYSLPDLKGFWQTTAPEVKLLRLSRQAGVDLLKTLGVQGTAQGFEALVEDVKGHALTLTLLGGFLKRAFHGDIRQRDRVKFEKADEKMDGGHAFRTMAAYEQWLLRDGGDEGRREVAVLRFLGLFDRPADAGCFHALLQAPVIPGLTEPLVGLAEEDWEFCLTGLESARLLTVHRDASADPQSAIGNWQSLDAHPHIREYFAKQLREHNPDAWRAAHRRLYEYLCASTPDKDRPTLEDLQPLYQAVAHGCQAGISELAYWNTYVQRILRGNVYYSITELGAYGADLSAVACFFELPWTQLATNISRPARARLLNQAAYCLEAVGRLKEALDPMQLAALADQMQGNVNNAATAFHNLSHIELALGNIAGAVLDAKISVSYADSGGEDHVRIGNRTMHGHALQQAGHHAEAQLRFHDAESMQVELNPSPPLVRTYGGFLYCDLLLAAPERAAWREMQKTERSTKTEECVATCHAVIQRGWETLRIAVANHSLLDIALDHLTLGRAALYAGILEREDRALRRARSPQRCGLASEEFETARCELEAAMKDLQRARRVHHIPRGLLTRSWLRFLASARTGPDSAQTDLDEAWDIAERGPMRLHMADIHLYRARLFFREEPYPWGSPAADLSAAEKLINECGYHRRDEELADAKRAILGA